MRGFPKTLLLSALLPLSSSMALPATTAPSDGDMAISFNAGFANAFDDTFDDVEPAFTGTFEYYTSPRISWRGLLGTMSFDAEPPSPGDSLSVDATFLNANIVYNWEGGRVHPYVTGGIGAYDKSASSNLPSEISSKFDETAFGVNGGGGLDWYLGESWALKFEGVVHALAGEDPKTIVIGTAGVKFWF